MNFSKVGKSKVAILKAMLTLLQWCCKQCPKETEVLVHMGLLNTAPQCGILCPSELRVLQLFPQEKGREQLLHNWEQITPVTNRSPLTVCLHLLLAHCFCSKESLNLPLQKMPREDPSLPAVSAGALACAKRAALQWSRHTRSEASIIDTYWKWNLFRHNSLEILCIYSFTVARYNQFSKSCDL